ncbi:hypothetical protein ElyMa_005731700 [Elysia marginata]|uniref:Uncharacterized protein n=1 Tax=Elysia marginata TaxID=1093978 RepID=A0AAV4FKX0_9GAST|nr:hypothetical protein ElyMa_005731700 [Elysia marginata]
MRRKAPTMGSSQFPIAEKKIKIQMLKGECCVSLAPFASPDRVGRIAQGSVLRRSACTFSVVRGLRRDKALRRPQYSAVANSF